MKPTHYCCQILKTLESVETVGCGDHPGGVDQGTPTQQHPVQLQSNLTRAQHNWKITLLFLGYPSLEIHLSPASLGMGCIYRMVSEILGPGSVLWEAVLPQLPPASPPEWIPCKCTGTHVHQPCLYLRETSPPNCGGLW